MVEYFVKFFARPSSNSKNYERVIFTFNYKRSFCINNSGINSASFVVSNLFVDIVKRCSFIFPCQPYKQVDRSSCLLLLLLLLLLQGFRIQGYNFRLFSLETLT